ncbi:HAD hydrolase-like protein [Zeaxanthinibacter enoshimensis]|uniref:Haloacid dehalogenase-like hydrolase n=1 Tax=Zeaxanthinibacter enoshimensis TaxID=392009 RepID=A0A4R6TRP4_9FLAO|nr:HAD hydrolase-like protein [Zeaxanthinibacter enoshimensis]TDQ31160.1 haloacid dehalogenase-like hydrolase [Zeaxanthinibacter enoshimensis]
MKTKLLKKLENCQSKEVIFTDLFDTIVHRTDHPNYVLKLWSKIIISELGLDLSIEELFSIRLQSVQYLTDSSDYNKVEIPYIDILEEIFSRLNNTGLKVPCDLPEFIRYSELADFRAESSLIYLNDKTLIFLKEQNKQGKKIILVTDTYLSDAIIYRLLEHLGIADLFYRIYVSSTERKSKVKGSIYPYILADLGLSSQEVMMIGDNKQSDYIRARENGIEAVHLKRLSTRLKDKTSLLGDQSGDLNKEITQVFNGSCSGKGQLGEYILFYYVFTEQLYHFAKKNRLKNLFFLAREGYFLKTLFDHYQEKHELEPGSRINTHYLKASRKSMMHASLKPLDKEEFTSLKEYDHMSVNNFLRSFFISEQNRDSILRATGLNGDQKIDNFIDSDELQILRNNPEFQAQYENHRLTQRSLFQKYFESFNFDFKKEPLVVVDIGWGGTMQEALSNIFKEKNVWGLYLGLMYIYNITANTPRWGLLFSVHPSANISDHILMANRQIYEQLASAPHGSVERYLSKENGFSHEVHNEAEKKIFKSDISGLQDKMMDLFDQLVERLYTKVYNKEDIFEISIQRFIKLSLFPSREKYRAINHLSNGFYQNIGAKKVGLRYSSTHMNKMKLFKNFILTPEKTFRYLVKIGPNLYQRGLFVLSPILFLIYLYLHFNILTRKMLFKKNLI